MVIGIVLAAGKSTRFGADKRKSRLHNGISVLEQSIKNARTSLDQIVVVLRSTDQSFAIELDKTISDPAISYFLAPDSSAGMAHSLANAINHIAHLATVESAMIFLGDMPYLKTETIDKLLHEFEENKSIGPIILPVISKASQDKDPLALPGHPVIFSSAYFQELTKLTGDGGAKKVITMNKTNVVRVPVEDMGILKDIDRPTDIEPNL